MASIVFSASKVDTIPVSASTASTAAFTPDSSATWRRWSITATNSPIACCALALSWGISPARRSPSANPTLLAWAKRSRWAIVVSPIPRRGSLMILFKETSSEGFTTDRR